MPCQNLKIKGPSENANGKTEKNWSLRNLYPTGKKTSTRCLEYVLLRQARHLADVQKMS